MSALAESLGQIRKPWQWIAIGGAILLVWSAVALPNLQQTKVAVPTARTIREEPAGAFSVGGTTMHQSAVLAERQDSKAVAAPASPATADGRKIIRTSSMEMVVQHPAEIADKITALAEAMGGFLVSADGGGQNATAATLTLRVPSARFEEARTEIRKLGLRVESERVDAQDVSRQYVDQDASIRNLQAEEAQYLAILKQANTVKDMLAVTERLSAVRGQIEQQQAEFNALSRQIETVAIAVSLRTEAEEKVLGLNWRPVYQLKLALHDGLESVATYATAMMSILFYLPAVVLWVGTIVTGTVLGWRAVRWAGRRWFGWNVNPAVEG